MLNYDAFRDYVGENVLDSFPEEFRGATVTIQKVQKTNTERYGLTLRIEDVNIVPNVYLESYYEEYKNGTPLDELMDTIAENYQRAMKENTLNSDITSSYDDWEVAKSHIVFDLVGREQNTDFNKNRPNRDFMDLSIAYRIVVSVDERGMASTVITNDLMTKLGVNEEQLYQAAYENTRNIYVPKIASLTEVLGPMMGADLGECPLFIATNELNINGATMLIYDDVLQDLTDRMMGPLYNPGDRREILIFPSSRHEILALDMNNDDIDIDYCQEMVQDINMMCVELEDRLSNNVYKYDAIEHKLTMATDVPNRRLDDIEQDKNRAI